MSQNLRQLSAGAAKTIKVLSTGLKCWLISGRYEACQPYKIRLLCCQLVTQREQKLLNEKVGSFHPVSVCVCPGLVRSKLREKMGRDPREAGRAIRSGFKCDPEWGERTGRKQLGGNILDWSSKESSFPQGCSGAKGCCPRIPASLRNRPAFESLPLSLIGRSSLWGVWLPLKWGNRCQNTAAGALCELCSSRPRPDCALSRPPRPTLALPHRFKEISSIVPMGLSSSGKF